MVLLLWSLYHTIVHSFNFLKVLVKSLLEVSQFKVASGLHIQPCPDYFLKGQVLMLNTVFES